MRLLIANVGPSELTLMDQPIRPPREGGFKVLQTLEALAEDLRMPYLYPCLKHLERAGEFPDSIVLLATDQGERRPSETDTIYLGRAIRRLLPYHFKITEEAVELLVFKDNPNDYEAALDYYREALYHMKAPSQVYIALTSAAAPLTSALLIQALLSFGDKVWVLYPGRLGTGSGAHLVNLGVRPDTSRS